MHSSRVPCNLVFASKLILSFCQFFPQFSQVLLQTFLLLISFSHNFLTDWPRVFFHKTDSCLIHCLYSRVAVWPSCAFLYLSIPSHVSLSVYSCMCNCYVWYECICVNPSFLRPCPAWCWKQPLPGLAVSCWWQSGWPVNPRGLPVSTLPGLGLQASARPQLLYEGPGDWTQVLLLA